MGAGIALASLAKILGLSVLEVICLILIAVSILGFWIYYEVSKMPSPPSLGSKNDDVAIRNVVGDIVPSPAIVVNEEPQKNSNNVCQNCSARFQMGDHFCGNCGSKL